MQPDCIRMVSAGLAQAAPRRSLPRWLSPMASKMGRPSVLLHGAARASSEHGGWLPKSMSQETGRRNGRFLPGWAWTLAHLSLPHAVCQAVPESEFLGKGQRPRFLMQPESDILGVMFKPPELVSQRRSTLPSHRPSPRRRFYLLITMVCGRMKKEMFLKPLLFGLNSVKSLLYCSSVTSGLPLSWVWGRGCT